MQVGTDSAGSDLGATLARRLLERQFALIRLEPMPTVRTEPFERAIARLIGHAPRILDPIAEIDIREAGAPGADDVIENDEIAETLPPRILRFEEAVDH